MNTRMLASLERVIANWMGLESEEVDYPREWSGNETSALMAKAAASVFDAVVEVQQFMAAEGYELQEGHNDD